MNFLDQAISWLAPVTCAGCGLEGSTLCEGCAGSSILPFGERCFICNSLSSRSRTCRSCRAGSPRYVWIVSDYEGLAKDTILAYKFGHQRAAAWPIARLMAGTFLKCNNQEMVDKANYLIVPVPTATSRVRQRGFDHAALLARQLARLLNADYKNVLVRLGQSQQIGAKRTQRLSQQVDSYLVRQSENIGGRNVLLIDDVVTTGATLKAATKVLRASGAAHVDALVFAKRL